MASSTRAALGRTALWEPDAVRAVLRQRTVLSCQLTVTPGPSVVQ